MKIIDTREILENDSCCITTTDTGTDKEKQFINVHYPIKYIKVKDVIKWAKREFNRDLIVKTTDSLEVKEIQSK
jgi:hypothetical protein